MYSVLLKCCTFLLVTSTYTLRAFRFSRQITFMNIENIHAVRESFQRLEKLSLGTTSASDLSWGRSAEDSRWLHHQRHLLNAAHSVASLVHLKNEPVLVHCSHGWDRTSQVPHAGVLCTCCTNRSLLLGGRSSSGAPLTILMVAIHVYACFDLRSRRWPSSCLTRSTARWTASQCSWKRIS